MVDADEWVDGTHVWPDNHDVWEVWRTVAATQWHTKLVKTRMLYERLDYAAVEIVMKAQGIRKRDRRRVFEGVVEMERAALPVMNEG